ncbi:MAG: hypothetical protein M3Y41_09870 [Pseudomonadota bacterium]|nr:hypothetical protein [Pseudomonadota bacterium]
MAEINRRRAVSAAYYALFHLFTEDGADRIAHGSSGVVRARVARAYEHAQMRRVCDLFGRNGVAASPLRWNRRG